MKDLKKEIPVLKSTSTYNSLIYLMGELQSFFHDVLYPGLLRLGKSDDTYAGKCLSYDSMEQIYDDALKESAETLRMLENLSSSFGEDFWKPFRTKDCSCKSPKEKGFVFAESPLRYAYKPHKEIVLKAVSIKNGAIVVDDSVLREECIIKPTKESLELYELLDNFCEVLNEKNINKRTIKDLFIQTNEGIKPYFKGIVIGSSGLY